MANRAMLLALDSTDAPAEHDGMYPRGALLAANYSVPILWLSLFDTNGLLTWPGINDGPAFTAVVQPRSECIQRSHTRLADWNRRWPEVFADMSKPWLSYLGAVEGAYLAVWAEELSWMEGDESWAADLRTYLNSLDDQGSASFQEALSQSYLYPDGNRLEPSGTVGLAAAGYTWTRQAPWEEPDSGPLWQRCATSVPEWAENCGHQRSSTGTANVLRPGYAQAGPLPFDEFPSMKVAPARTRTTRWGALTARQRSCADSISLNAMTRPAAREPGLW